jgi:hypothetical protein
MVTLVFLTKVNSTLSSKEESWSKAMGHPLKGNNGKARVKNKESTLFLAH